MTSYACKARGRVIRWATSPDGQLLRLDGEPHPHGTVLLLPRETCRPLDADLAAAYRQQGSPLHRIHECPRTERR